MASKAKKASKLASNVYRGYMPIGLPQHRPPNRIRPWWKVIGKPTLTIYPPKEVEEWAEEAEYPPLNDGTPAGLKKKVRLDWYESLKLIPTADQKQLEITKHCRHYCAQMSNRLLSYNPLPIAQYLTNTNISYGLPEKYKNSNIDQHLLDLTRKVVLDNIDLNCFSTYRSSFDIPRHLDESEVDILKKYKFSKMIQGIVASLKRILVADNQFMNKANLDLDPTIASWWWHSGFAEPRKKLYYKDKKDEDGFINTIIQMKYQNSLNIRYDSLLKPIVGLDDPLALDTDAIPKQDSSLKIHGAKYRWRHPAAMPGFWWEDEDKFDCPHTSFLSTEYLDTCLLKPYLTSQAEIDNHLNSQAIMTAFGWLNSIAAYHGFTPYEELTYPLTCQVVTTDGKNWAFHIYQMNTHTFHRDLCKKSKINNICWSSGSLPLYDHRDPDNGQFTKINDDVLKYLIMFMTNEPDMDALGTTGLRPYLSDDTRDDEQKLEDRALLKRYYENRYQGYFEHQRRVPLWEHIFKRSKEGRMLGLMVKPPYKGHAEAFPKIFD